MPYTRGNRLFAVDSTPHIGIKRFVGKRIVNSARRLLANAVDTIFALPQNSSESVANGARPLKTPKNCPEGIPNGVKLLKTSHNYSESVPNGFTSPTIGNGNRQKHPNTPLKASETL